MHFFKIDDGGNQLTAAIRSQWIPLKLRSNCSISKYQYQPLFRHMIDYFRSLLKTYERAEFQNLCGGLRDQREGRRSQSGPQSCKTGQRGMDEGLESRSRPPGSTERPRALAWRELGTRAPGQPTSLTQFREGVCLTQAPSPARTATRPQFPGKGWVPTPADSPVDGVLKVQVFQATQDLSRIEQGSLLLEAGVPHVVDVELQVPPIHDGQNQAQRVLGLVGIGQVDLGARDSTEVRFCDRPPLPPFLLWFLEAGVRGTGLGELQQLHACWPPIQTA